MQCHYFVFLSSGSLSQACCLFLVIHLFSLHFLPLLFSSLFLHPLIFFWDLPCLIFFLSCFITSFISKGRCSLSLTHIHYLLSFTLLLLSPWPTFPNCLAHVKLGAELRKLEQTCSVHACLYESKN